MTDTPYSEVVLELIEKMREPLIHAQAAGQVGTERAQEAVKRHLSDEVTLCQETHVEAVRGACPMHGGDACLRQYTPVLQEKPEEPQA